MNGGDRAALAMNYHFYSKYKKDPPKHLVGLKGPCEGCRDDDYAALATFAFLAFTVDFERFCIERAPLSWRRAWKYVLAPLAVRPTSFWNRSRISARVSLSIRLLKIEAARAILEPGRWVFMLMGTTPF